MLNFKYNAIMYIVTGVAMEPRTILIPSSDRHQADELLSLEMGKLGRYTRGSDWFIEVWSNCAMDTSQVEEFVSRHPLIVEPPKSLGRDEVPVSDPINHPQHYNQSPIEVIDAIEAWGFDFCEGRIVQLLFESRIVGASMAMHNLNRIKWYVDRLIARDTPKGAKLKEGDAIKFTVKGTDSLPEDESA